MIESGVVAYNGSALEHKVGAEMGGSMFDMIGNRSSLEDVLDRPRVHNISAGVLCKLVFC